MNNERIVKGFDIIEAVCSGDDKQLPNLFDGEQIISQNYLSDDDFRSVFRSHRYIMEIVDVIGDE